MRMFGGRSFRWSLAETGPVYAVLIRPVNFAILVDGSGSIVPDEWEKAK